MYASLSNQFTNHNGTKNETSLKVYENAFLDELPSSKSFTETYMIARYIARRLQVRLCYRTHAGSCLKTERHSTTVIFPSKPLRYSVFERSV